MLNDGYYLERRAALQTRADGGPAYFALNDIVVRKAGASRMVPFGLQLDGEMVAHLSADGIVIATPTGSTAVSSPPAARSSAPRSMRSASSASCRTRCSRAR